MSSKRFSQSLYDQNDELAKNTLEKIRDFFGVQELREPNSQYTVDREGYRDGVHVVNVEVEIKQKWQEGQRPFPYVDINLPFRKAKFFDLPLPTYFVIFSADCKGAMVFSDITAKASPVKEVRNKYVSNGEKFFKVPLEMAAYIQIELE